MSSFDRLAAVVLVLSAAFLACVNSSSPPPAPSSLTPLRTDRTYLRDELGRYVLLHGINVSCSTKLGPPARNSRGEETYVGRPFGLDQAATHYARLRAMGLNTLRLLVPWEAIEPRRRGEYDEEYLTYLRALVELAQEYGLYVLIDFHQDIFSRHLFVRFNSAPAEGEPGSIENSLLALVQPFNDRVQGDGAPRWAVEACLPEKKLDSKHWGTPRITSGLTEAELRNLFEVYQKLLGGRLLAGGDVDGGTVDAGSSASGADGGELPSWVYQLALNLPGEFPPDETTDLLPFTNWAAASVLSLDVARAYACFFAGDKVFPGQAKDGVDVKEYLQSAYAAAAARTAQRLGDLPNVIGYDLMNEPSGNFLPLAALAGLMKAGAPGAERVLVTLLGPENGKQVLRALLALRLLPPDGRPETLKQWGVDRLDVAAALGLNNGFDEQHLRPFYERVGQAILEQDADAVIWVESSRGLSSLLGGGAGGGLLPGLWEQPMQHPRGVSQLVYAPHFYPDIYPFLGFNVPPRSFTAEQLRYRDYDQGLEKAAELAAYSLGNVPVVFGEFGSYFNFNGIKNARRSGYQVTAQLLDTVHEAFERKLRSNLLWCYSPENDFIQGDGWNREDFSVLERGQTLRGELAWSRPYARALAGKPISTHFFSDYHVFNPEPGVVPPRREFEVRYGSRESQMPTEIAVPQHQYPEGFYVWLSDGRCVYDPRQSILYHLPESDAPGAEHWVRLRPPLPQALNDGWQYFFNKDFALERGQP